ncbi:MAG: glycoside hydrolase TIM-barrel-like domain-containing protein, partial [Boseongicola sp.]|nr:glycoside hydrolase TIM-barrel-like domain-containing protein [Boseongicola sp.]
MATILLSAAGGAVGASIGGSVLGISAAVAGRAVGATIGRVIDSKLLGAGSPAVETGRVDRFRISGASEGAPIAHVHGRVRVSGQVIWASQFLESSTTTGGGKGAPSQPKTTSYSYSVSLAIALCEGEVSRVGRIWADGTEISKADVTMRFYPGSATQLPDPKIEAIEGLGEAPAYRGTSYVVFENLQLGPFGNRVPQFSFEVMRTGEGDPADHIRALALIPGTGEYALATTPVLYSEGPGLNTYANVNTASGEADILTALDSLAEEAPNCTATSLIVSWFGDDLRCGNCQIRPLVEQTATDGVGMPWEVSGIARASASQVPTEDGRPIYGGTPADASVLEAIAALKNIGQDVMFYPFVLMTQTEGNTLTDPWTGDTGQPSLPWRGRVTTSLAPNVPNSPDGTAAAIAEVSDFFGTATASDFVVDGDRVLFTGADGFTYRRFILHYAHLCAIAGGVDAFCIGSEMRGLTQIRGGNDSFPAVHELIDLAAEVRDILGANTKISYAADWTEYFGYQPLDGSGNVYFHLDPLWSDDNIDFVGIDNYMPLSDWRDGIDHVDSEWGSIYNVEYLKSNIEGGEGYDWYYKSASAEALQIRSDITDGAYQEPWVYRFKDIRGWWENAHYDRVGGVRSPTTTEWIPGSKPIWFCEIGCAAIDKGTNQPNKFLDPKSSESSLPKYSTGARDDLMQMQYLRAITEYWNDSEKNPVSNSYSGRMIDTNRMFVWAWDARPYPNFPGNSEVWSDGDNYSRGHWLSGRISARSLAGVVSEICQHAGIEDFDVSELYGLVRGFHLDGSETPRALLQSLMLATGVDATEKNGVLTFKNRTGRPLLQLTTSELAEVDGSAYVKQARDPLIDVPD